MKRCIAICCAVALSVTAAAAEYRLKKGDTLHVLAVSGLNLRATPEPAGKVIATVPYGGRVSVLEVTAREHLAENIKGRWIRARAGGKEGYVFDGFLSRLPAPDIKNPHTMEEYAESMLGKDGGAHRDGMTTVQKYKKGVEIQTTGAEGFNQTDMRIEGIGLPEAFLLGRSFAIGMDWWFSQKDVFPLLPGKYRETYRTRDGQSFRLDVTVEVKKDARGEIVDVNITKVCDGYQRTLHVRRGRDGAVIVMAVND